MRNGRPFKWDYAEHREKSGFKSPRGPMPRHEAVAGLVSTPKLAASKVLLNMSGFPMAEGSIRAIYFQGKLVPKVVTESGYPLWSLSDTADQWEDQRGPEQVDRSKISEVTP